MQKLLTFFQQKISEYCILNPLKTVNEMTVNELVKLTMFCTTGPRFLHIDIIIMLCMYNVFKEIYRVFKDLSKSVSLSDTSQAKLTLKNVLEILRIFARLNMYNKIAVLL